MNEHLSAVLHWLTMQSTRRWRKLRDLGVILRGLAGLARAIASGRKHSPYTLERLRLIAQFQTSKSHLERSKIYGAYNRYNMTLRRIRSTFLRKLILNGLVILGILGLSVVSYSRIFGDEGSLILAVSLPFVAYTYVVFVMSSIRWFFTTIVLNIYFDVYQSLLSCQEQQSYVMGDIFDILEMMVGYKYNVELTLRFFQDILKPEPPEMEVTMLAMFDESYQEDAKVFGESSSLYIPIYLIKHGLA